MTEKVIDKIQKLLNMANGDAAGGEHERNTAMKMALTLLAKHNLSMADCETKQEGREAEYMEQYVCPWRRTVANSLAKLYFSHFFSTKIPGRQKLKFSFIGLESNVQTASQMTSYVIASLTKEVIKARKENGEPASWETSFFNAAAGRISERCWVMREEAEAASKPKATGTGLALTSVYENETKANVDFIKDSLGITLKMRPSRLDITNHNGAAAGRAFGDKMNLSNQLGGAKTTSLKIK